MKTFAQFAQRSAVKTVLAEAAKARISPKELETLKPVSSAEITARRVKIYEEFLARPTAALAQEMLELEATADSAAKVWTSLHGALRERERRRMGEKVVPLLAEAIDEVIAGLNQQRAAFVADDEQRTKETGARFESTNALFNIDRAIEQLRESVLAIRVDPERALSALRTIVEPKDK